MSSGTTARTENLQADVVVMGAGGAGLAAAVTAAGRGCRIIVLEKRSGPGGNTAMAEGIFAAESPAQKRVMIDARSDDLFKTAMEYAHWKINPRLVRTFIDRSADTIAWLEEKGINLDSVRAQYPNQTPLVWHVPREKDGRRQGVGVVVRALVKECEDLGVKLLYHAPGKKILTGKQGRVTGVVAVTEKGELTVTARSVIIATGGYGGNRELLRKYCPSYHENMYCSGYTYTHTGDGLLMALETGAATEGLGALLLQAPGIHKALRISAVLQEPQTLWVNKRGERFTDEGVTFYFTACGHAVNRQPDKLSYTLFDAGIKQTIMEHGILKGAGTIYLAQGSKMPDLDGELQAGCESGHVKVSSSWDEIASWIGADPGVLKDTVDEYNAACDRGYDPVFTKDRRYLLPLRTPPYYAIKSRLNFLDTLGGIKINESTEVIDSRGNPIPGLFAAGVITGGWESESYCEALSGHACGFTISSGRIAGERAFEYDR